MPVTSPQAALRRARSFHEKAAAPAGRTALPGHALVGQRIEAVDEGGVWWPGGVTAAYLNGTYDVVFDDGTSAEGVPRAAVRSLDVLAYRKLNHKYRRYCARAAIAAWAQRRLVARVRAHRATLAHARQCLLRTRFDVGDRVWVLWRHGGDVPRFAGSVSRRTPGGGYHVVYDDGDEEHDVPPAIVSAFEFDDEGSAARYLRYVALRAKVASVCQRYLRRKIDLAAMSALLIPALATCLARASIASCLQRRFKRRQFKKKMGRFGMVKRAPSFNSPPPASPTADLPRPPPLRRSPGSAKKTSDGSGGGGGGGGGESRMAMLRRRFDKNKAMTTPPPPMRALGPRARGDRSPVVKDW